MRAPRRGIVLERGLVVRRGGVEHGAAHAPAHWQAGWEARAPGEMPTGRDARGTLCCARNKRFRQRADGSESGPCRVVPAAQEPCASYAFHSTFKILHSTLGDAVAPPRLCASAGVLFAFPPPLPRAKLSAAF